MTPSDEFSKIISERDRIIAKEVKTLYASFVKASPVDTGSFRGAWDIKQHKLTWSITNNMEYASILFKGRRKVGNKWLGSNQWSDGGYPMIQRFENKLQRELDDIRN